MPTRPGRKPGSIPWNKGLTKADDPRVAQPWLGKKRDPETIAKISQSKVGSRHSDQTKEKIAAAQRGRERSAETRAKIADAMHRIGRPAHMKGTASLRWTGTNRNGFRKVVLERDGRICAKCGAPGTEVDHIVPVHIAPERKFDFSNLQTLCRPCHRAKTNAELTAKRLRRAGQSSGA